MYCYVYYPHHDLFRSEHCVCFLSPNFSSIEMLSGMRLTLDFSKCCRKKESNTVSDEISWSLKKLRIIKFNK